MPIVVVREMPKIYKDINKEMLTIDLHYLLRYKGILVTKMLSIVQSNEYI